MFKRISLFAAAAALSASAGLAHAAYPERPITIVSPFPAGGATDTLTRVLAERMAKALDQSIIVENKAGAGTTIGAAYVAKEFNNIMDLLQLVFAFVNAPLFATFALGMFWRRATGHGAFFGLLSGTLAAAVHHGLTFPAGTDPGGFKGGYILNLLHRIFPTQIEEAVASFTYRSEMAQNFWTAIYAFSTCLVVSVAISIFTKPRPAEDLKGLVYSLTPKPDEGDIPWYKRPAALAIVVLVLTAVLNIIFY